MLEKISFSDEELSEMSGEKNVQSAPKYSVPIIRLDGKKGGFTKIIITDKGKEEVGLGESFKGLMLKFRRSYMAWTDETSMFTNEHNSGKDMVTLMEASETKKGRQVKMIDTGLPNNLRQKYQNLKMVQQIYMLVEGEVVKLQVKGKGLSHLFDYQKEFMGSEHSFQYVTEVSQSEEESKLGSYYAITFIKGEKVEDMGEIANKIKEVAGEIAAIDDYYKNYNPVKPEDELPEEGVQDSPQELPIINDEEIPIKEDELNIKDIPF